MYVYKRNTEGRSHMTVKNTSSGVSDLASREYTDCVVRESAITHNTVINYLSILSIEITDLKLVKIHHP
jgi:hypothetical protein